MPELTQHDRDHAELALSAREELIAAAREAQAAAYCPYSNFRVGAAVLASDGAIYKGCNVENASYGLTICAERNAIAAAIGAGQIELAAIAVVTSAKSLARPCGACRQVIAEFSRRENPIIVICANDIEIAIEKITDLLPETFSLL